jgi:hypothetical protein
MIGGLLLAVKSPAGGGVTSATKSYTDRTRYGRETDDGSRYLGDGRFIAPSGELYRDPRYA